VKKRLSVELSLEIWFGRDQSCCKYGWWFQIFFIFTRIPGEIIQFDNHIFQMTSWIDQYHHFLKLPMRLVLKILELARDLGVNSHPDSRKRNCHVFFTLRVKIGCFSMETSATGCQTRRNALNFQTSRRNASLMLWFVWSNKSSKAVKQLMNE